MLALAYKGIDFESVRIDPSTQYRQTSSYLALNPRGKSPVLSVIDTEGAEQAIYESIAILAYLEAQYPTPGLLGEDAMETAKVWQSMAELVHYVSEPCIELSRSVFRGTLLDDLQHGQAEAKKFYDELQRLESRLNGRDFLALDTVSLADFYFYPTLAFFLRILDHQNAKSIAAYFHPFSTEFPNLNAWMQRIEKVKGFVEAYPPHWKN